MLLFFGVSVPLVLSAKLPKQYAKNYYLGTQMYEKIQKDKTNIVEYLFRPSDFPPLTWAPIRLPPLLRTSDAVPTAPEYPTQGPQTPYQLHPNTPSATPDPTFSHTRIPSPAGNNGPPSAGPTHRTGRAPLPWARVRFPRLCLARPSGFGYQPPNEPFVKKFLGHFFISRFF